MFKELNEKDMAAANAAMKPIIEELVEKWGNVGNEVIGAHYDELQNMFPEHARKIACMTVMSALPGFVTGCCLSISPNTHMQLAVTHTAEVLTNALEVDRGHAKHEHTLLQSIKSMLGRTSDDDTSDDDDRGAAEH